MHQTVRNGSTLVIFSPIKKVLILPDDISACAVQDRLKDIDAKLEASRLSLYRDAFGDGVLGLTDQDLL